MNLEKLAYPYENVRPLLTDFYTIFPRMRYWINRLRCQNEKDIDYSRKSFVDIYKIAYDVGIKEIKEVSFEDIQKVAEIAGVSADNLLKLNLPTKHAIIIKEKAIILLNKKNKLEEKYFSIAHEIFHYIFWKYYSNEMSFFVQKKDIWTKLLRKHFNENESNTNSEHGQESSIAARENTEILNKHRNILKKIPLDYGVLIQYINIMLKKDISDVVEDELADYFAANLIVPTERFVLWKYKKDEKTARAFKVTRKCISKRRDELNYELEAIAPKELSSGIDLEKITLFTSNKMNHSPEGYNINALKQA